MLAVGTPPGAKYLESSHRIDSLCQELRAGHPALRQGEQPFELPPVEANHGLPINEGDGCGPVPHLQELFHRCLVFADVLVRECDALLRKKLFLCMARPSPGLTVHDHLFCHRFSSADGEALGFLGGSPPRPGSDRRRNMPAEPRRVPVPASAAALRPQRLSAGVPSRPWLPQSQESFRSTQ